MTRNAQGITQKSEELIEFLSTEKPDVVLIHETWLGNIGPTKRLI